MDKFEGFIVKKYPNRSAKVLLHKLQDNDGTWFYAVNEVQDQSEAWQSRQAEVDELQEEYADTELYLRGQLTDRDSKITILEYLLEQDKSLIPILNKKLEEKDKRIEELEMWIKGHIETLKCASKSWAYTEREQNIMLSQADDLDKALRGKDQYTEHRAKAEEQINKGARLTKHQIDLGDNNANS